MNLLFPFISIFKFANAIGTTIFVAQIVWWIFKKYKELDSKKLRNSEVKTIFVKEFLKKFKRMPTNEELQVTIKAVNSVDHPLKEKITNFINSLLKEKDE